jgi:hypothetical protein
LGTRGFFQVGCFATGAISQVAGTRAEGKVGEHSQISAGVD